jgi:hypothetical protein
MRGLELMGAGAEGVGADDVAAGPVPAHVERLVELMTAHAAAGS